MAGIKAAKRYAKGLIHFANESNQAEKVNSEMKDLKASIVNSRELAVFLASPVLDAKRKIKIASELFGGFSTTTQNFIKLVINQGRGDILGEIASEYNGIYNHQNKISVAEVISATPLNDGLVSQIVETAKQQFNLNHSIQIENKVNPDLIGGFILRIGDKQIDSSVLSKLTRLKKEFEKNEYIPKF